MVRWRAPAMKFSRICVPRLLICPSAPHSWRCRAGPPALRWVAGKSVSLVRGVWLTVAHRHRNLEGVAL
jgi:hypothetical protein